MPELIPAPSVTARGKRLRLRTRTCFSGDSFRTIFSGALSSLIGSAVQKAFQALSKQLDIPELELAEGLLSVANAGMERAVRVISVERGFDPGEFTLLSFGGAGGMHAADLARLLGIPRVLIPRHPGILSAMGMLLSDIIKDFSLTIMHRGETSPRNIRSLLHQLEQQGQASIRQEGVRPEDITLERYLDMRYQGQSFELMVPFEENYQERFHDLHEKTYGFADRNRAVELVNLRLRARGRIENPDLQPLSSGSATIPEKAIIGRRPVLF